MRRFGKNFMLWLFLFLVIFVAIFSNDYNAAPTYPGWDKGEYTGFSICASTLLLATPISLVLVVVIDKVLGVKVKKKNDLE